MIDIATGAALEAGALLREGFGKVAKIRHKEGSHNLVTEFDVTSERLIVDKIQSAFPDHHFLAEEEHTAPPEQGPNKDVVWIIDPLDGTVNFAHGIPAFAVSIAAAIDEEIVLGVVYDPLLDELFLAEKGKGTTLNGIPIEVTRTTQMNDALLATGFPYNVADNPHHCIERFVSFLHRGRPIRRIGVAALDLAYLAAGRFDIFWEASLHPWDRAAGELLVTEAGGMISNYDGSPLPFLTAPPTLATNGHFHQEMVDTLKGDLL